MQVVRAAGELPEALATARRVAAAAFGDDTLLLERLIERPRHIEVQVLADAHGTVDPPRRARVLAAAPAPEGHRRGAVAGASTPRPARALGAAACAAAASVDYRGAGTVEFLVADDRPDEFFFIEMNTRLQVEHPVTELVTGLDLVEQQLRDRGGRAARARAGRRAPRPVTRSRRASTPRAPRAGSCPRPGTVLALASRRRRACASTAAVETGIARRRRLRPDARQGHRAAAPTAPRRSRGSTPRSPTPSCSASTPTSRSCARCSPTPTVRAGDLDTGLIDRMPPFAAPPPTPAALEAAASRSSPSARRRGSTRRGSRQARSGWRVGLARRGRATVRAARRATAASVVATDAGRSGRRHRGAGRDACSRPRRSRSTATAAIWVHARRRDASSCGRSPRRAALEPRLAGARPRAGATGPRAARPDARHRRRRARRRRRDGRGRATASSRSRP